ncbi:hypothetical protein [Nocardiopsis lambiniae]|uniref:Uncharacterized protein n=1 Tax=Nocardiopsis lambiniae TaxID=3075539 RepID=A0ABU2M7U8_9ACTN|nr:hypothetical protein [Nocardiopsis sp. DSM 44743]MDT0328740.1 hypothetical protein [Nocardiopsis sp. DSM 44743]
MDWPTVVLILGLGAIATFIGVVVVSSRHEFRKTAVDAARNDELRRLVTRYEELASTTLDAQQRTAADVAELRARTTSIEKLLRTVE